MKEQLDLGFTQKQTGRGGRRPGAGRKPLPQHLRRTPHRARAKHRPAHPVHVTLRAGVRSLRHEFIAQTVLRAFRDSNSELFRVVHYSHGPGIHDDAKEIGRDHVSISLSTIRRRPSSCPPRCSS
jgi:hypothetical protein